MCAKIAALKIQFSISYIKNKIKIDSQNQEHLQYWHNLTGHCCHGNGGEEIMHYATGAVYRVPNRIKAMMVVANRQFDNPIALLRALDAARRSKTKLLE